MNMAVVKSMIDAAPPVGDCWPEPQTLLASLAAEPYPLDALPETLRDAVAEVQAFTKAPMPLVAASALSALSVSAQALVDVRRAEKLTGPVGLFMLSIADSGERKSTCDGFFTTAIRDYERQQAEEGKPKLAKFRADTDAWEASRSGVMASIKQAACAGKTIEAEDGRTRLEALENRKPVPPRIPRLGRGDETPENLAWGLAREYPSAGVISSEAGLILGAHAMGSETIMRNLGLLNIFWDGGTLSIGRRTSESFTVRGARLTMGLQVQEATLRSFFDRSGGLARGTGFLARFLVAWPESTQGFRYFVEAPETWPSLAQFNQRLATLLAMPAPLTEEGGLEPMLLGMTPEAKALWVAFHDAIEGELCSGGELYDVRDVAAKTADNAARLAALFHVLEYGLGGAIAADTFEGASRLAAWHLHEARRFFGELAMPDDVADAVRLDGWLLAHCRRNRVASITRRDLQRNVTPINLRKKDRLNLAMRELEEAGRIRELTDGKQKTIHVNPALLNARAS